MNDTYSRELKDWMDGPGGYRAWWEERFGEGAVQPLSGGGPNDPPPVPPKKP